jgi:hypothetical protein
MRTLTLAAVVATPLLLSASFAVQAQPQPAKPPHQASRCFRTHDWQGWKAAPDARTIYLHALGRDYYRLDLVGQCSELNSPNAHLVNTVRGSDQVCSAIDLDLKVSTGMGFASPCLVKSVRPMTDDEVAALPKKLKP